MILCLENYLEILYYIAGIISAILALPSYLIHRHNQKLQKSVDVIKDFQINIYPKIKNNMTILNNPHIALIYIDDMKNVVRHHLLDLSNDNHMVVNLLNNNIEHFVARNAEARVYSSILNSIETWSINVNKHMTLNKLVKKEVSTFYVNIINKVVNIIGDSNMKELFPQCWKLFKKWNK